MNGACQQFLAGSGITGDQYRQIVSGDFFCQLADFIQRTVGGPGETVETGLCLGGDAPAGHLARQEFRAVAQFQRQSLVLLLQAPQIGRTLQGQQ